jgi:hypothetical protein
MATPFRMSRLLSRSKSLLTFNNYNKFLTLTLSSHTITDSRMATLSTSRFTRYLPGWSIFSCTAFENQHYRLQPLSNPQCATLSMHAFHSTARAATFVASRKNRQNLFSLFAATGAVGLSYSILSTDKVMKAYIGPWCLKGQKLIILVLLRWRLPTATLSVMISRG